MRMNRLSWIFIVLVLFCHMRHAFQDKLTKYITKCGYPAEVHKIITEDGYVLKTHRIPHGRTSNKTNENVVLLAHGMAGSAENFICLGPDDALAFLLAERGFDVWLFNARGTFHSRRHKRRSPNFFRGSGFWNFSFHEIGVYDLPANIDYILENTNKTYIFYVGHSQGGTSYLILTSEKPEYNKKIKAASLLAPGVLMQYTESTFIKFFTRLQILGERLVNIFNYYELVVPNNILLNNVLKWFCRSSSNLMEACRDLLSFTGGQDSGLVNISLIPAIADHAPSGFSVHQAFHYSQIIRSGSFKRYDYGKNANLLKYNSTVPPEYNLNNSVTPVALIMANGDTLVSMKSIYELSKILPNVVITYEVPYNNFNHIDYVYAYNAKELVYEPVYDFLMQFVKN